mmetsp:Transcript_27549/g.64651  ORF Transcript_27549/g.64651 Transcript_27549/m.64651 type:complete len:615 (-) Transcript_27549:395-2239(-)
MGIARYTRTGTTELGCLSDGTENDGHPTAVLFLRNTQSTEQKQMLVHALKVAGYDNVSVSEAQHDPVNKADNSHGMYFYELSRATGMLKLVSSPLLSSSSPTPQNMSTEETTTPFLPPRWVPVVRGQENVLVTNGWSFLDPDENEPLSAFDIDDANAEGEYRPKWGQDIDAQEQNRNFESNYARVDTTNLKFSSLGYDLSPLAKEDVSAEVDSLSPKNSCWENPHSRGVLLRGETDPPNTKTTCNGYQFRGSAGQSDIPKGIFFTAIGGLPLFSSLDLSPTTGSSGWLTFSRPLEASHVIHIDPEKDSTDRRIEVVCARSRCHLGHYFGPTEGYCINASALRFIPRSTNEISKDVTVGSDASANHVPARSKPTSWRPLDAEIEEKCHHHQITPSYCLLKSVLENNARLEQVVLGCGCFWHVEYALRRLPGVVATEACYAGGHTDSPSYQDVCEGSTGHAEGVSVVYDPDVCPTDVLFDCFLAMHNPTKVRAHGKHALHTGQYRSCIFVTDAEIDRVAHECLDNCRQQLGKNLSTQIQRMNQQQHQKFGEGWCWRAEDRHQRHDERVKGKSNVPRMLSSATEWLNEYGRRTPSVNGSSLESLLHPDDDGFAMMMI